jgi:hypothetical protein
MHFICDGRLRRLLLTTALVVVAALGITSATSARVDVGSSGSATFALTTNDKVTLCHAAGRDGTTQFVTLTISYKRRLRTGRALLRGRDSARRPRGRLSRAVQPAAPDRRLPQHRRQPGRRPGRDDQERTGQLRHAHTPTDVCPNIEGNQADVPPG